jgi:hypothetical protein
MTRSDVRFREQSGRSALVLSFALDPRRTLLGYSIAVSARRAAAADPKRTCALWHEGISV